MEHGIADLRQILVGHKHDELALTLCRARAQRDHVGQGQFLREDVVDAAADEAALVEEVEPGVELGREFTACGEVAEGHGRLGRRQCGGTERGRYTALHDDRDRPDRIAPAVGHRKGGANIKPPADHSALTPRGSLMGLPAPTFRS